MSKKKEVGVGELEGKLQVTLRKKKKTEIHCLCLNPHSVIIRTKVLADFWLIFLPIV